MKDRGCLVLPIVFGFGGGGAFGGGRSVIIKYGKCVFLTKNQIHKTFFLGFENECKIVSKMI